MDGWIGLDRLEYTRMSGQTSRRADAHTHSRRTDKPMGVVPLFRTSATSRVQFTGALRRFPTTRLFLLSFAPFSRRLPTDAADPITIAFLFSSCFAVRVSIARCEYFVTIQFLGYPASSASEKQPSACEQCIQTRRKTLATRRCGRQEERKPRTWLFHSFMNTTASAS